MRKDDPIKVLLPRGARSDLMFKIIHAVSWPARAADPSAVVTARMHEDGTWARLEVRAGQWTPKELCAQVADVVKVHGGRVVCETNLEVFALHEAGLNAVALTSGTAPTRDMRAVADALETVERVAMAKWFRVPG